MNLEFNFHFPDLSKLHERLSYYSEEKRIKRLRRAIAIIANELAKQMRRLIRMKLYNTGTLAKSIGKKTRYYKQTGALSVIVGVKSKYSVSIGNGRRYQPSRIVHILTRTGRKSNKTGNINRVYDFMAEAKSNIQGAAIQKAIAAMDKLDAKEL